MISYLVDVCDRHIPVVYLWVLRAIGLLVLSTVTFKKYIQLAIFYERGKIRERISRIKVCYVSNGGLFRRRLRLHQAPHLQRMITVQGDF